MRTSLTPVRLTDDRQVGGNQRVRKAAFVIGLFAVILEFAISGNTLEVMGISYCHHRRQSAGQAPSRQPTWSAIAGFMVLFLARPAGSGLVRFFRRTPALATFIVLILFCAFYSIVNVGISGAAIYVESYLSGGMLAVALEGGTDRQKQASGVVDHWLSVSSASSFRSARACHADAPDSATIG